MSIFVVTSPLTTSDDVTLLQRMLTDLGYSVGKAGIDGKYGNDTDAAKTEYMIAKGLMPDPNAVPGTEHFRIEEWRCKDGSDVPTKYYGNLNKLMAKLEDLRHAAGDRPITIVSGYRSPEYNEALRKRSSGVAKNSQHLYATAADIRVSGLTPSQVYKLADPIFKDGGMGKYDTFVHVDVGPARRW